MKRAEVGPASPLLHGIPIVVNPMRVSVWRPLVLVVALTSFVVTLPASSSAASIKTFTASGDTYVRSDRPSTNYGGAARVVDDTSPVIDALLRFDVVGATGSTIERATLRLHCVDGSPAGGTVAPTSASWGERTVTWSTAPAASGPAVGAIGAVVKGSWYEVDVTSLVNGDGAFAFRLAGGSTNAAGYTSREGSASFRPQLVVTLGASVATPPTVEITSPTHGSTVQGTVSLTASASDDTGVASVTFAVDETPAGTDLTAPYVIAWDTTATTNGDHILVATATDVDGVSTTSTPVTVDVENPPPSPPPDRSFTFAAGGDLSMSAVTDASLANLDGSHAQLYLALGDLDHSASSPDAAWCDYVTSRLPTKGPSFPFELVAGNHEQDGAAEGNIETFASCLPDRLGAVVEPGSMYGAEYYVDYPPSSPLMRIIMISPHLTIAGTTYSFGAGSPHRDWLVSTIRNARSSGIPWVAVGLHFHCLTTGDRVTCDMGTALWNLLLAEHVDLILNGHEHSYQRSKQLARNSATCASMAINTYNAGCIADDGADDVYPKGAGTVNVVTGVFGEREPVNPDDAEARYFARISGASNGFTEFSVAPDRIDARFVASTGSFTDSFSIIAGATASADVTAPSAPAGVTGNATGETQVELSWQPAEDASGIARYGILRDGVRIGTSTTTAFTDTSAIPGARHDYAIEAYDPAGNFSVRSASATVVVPGPAPVLVFPSAGDATIQQAYPDSARSWWSFVEADAAPVKQFLTRFHVAGIGAAQVTHATLRMYCVDSSNASLTFSRVAADWGEGTVTWNTAPAPGPTAGTLIPSVTGTWYDVDVTPAVTGDGDVAFRTVGGSGDIASFSSRDGDLQLIPQLIVTLAP